MDELYQAPLQAVRAFEEATGLAVAIHDLSGQLRDFLPPEYFLHRTAACQSVKARLEHRCVEFDVNKTRAALHELPAGRVHMCHAGFVECAVPVWRDERLEWVLFAGQRRPGKGFAEAGNSTPQLDSPQRKAGLTANPDALSAADLLAPVDYLKACVWLELLRQLAARLENWRCDLARSAAAPVPFGRSGERATDMTTRRTLIQRFIQSRHVYPLQLSDLAAHLHLSESRAGHAIREACGVSFVELLREARLKTAEVLLRHSNLSVLEISLRSGFGDLSHFHNVFRKRFRTTPHQYRRKAAATSVPV